MTYEQPVSRFPVPALHEMPEDIRKQIEEVQQKSGFIPNVFLVLAHRPEEFRAFFAYHDALMEKLGNLIRRPVNLLRSMRLRGIGDLSCFGRDSCKMAFDQHILADRLKTDGRFSVIDILRCSSTAL